VGPGGRPRQDTQVRGNSRATAERVRVGRAAGRCVWQACGVHEEGWSCCAQQLREVCLDNKYIAFQMLARGVSMGCSLLLSCAQVCPGNQGSKQQST
jgi:hypothetical protein